MIALALLAALSLTELPAVAKAANLTEAEFQKASSGEVVVKGELSKNAKGEDVGRGRAWLVIDAPPEKCFAQLQRYEEAPQFLPRVSKVVFPEKTKEKMRVTQSIKVVLSTYTYTMIFVFNDAKKQMDWTLDKSVENDIVDTAGTWLFTDLGNGKTLLDYGVSVDTGKAVPKFLSDYMTKRDLPDVLLNFKKRVESGGKWTRD